MAKEKYTAPVNRKIWVDGLRGLAMVFVIYGHLAGGWTEYYVFTSAVKIPLFFAITGYVFKLRDGDTQKFLKNIAIKIGIPWIMLTLLPLKVAYNMVRLNFSGAFSYVWKFITGGVYWYMPCCIAAEIIFFFILKHSRTTLMAAGWAVVITICGFFLVIFNVKCLTIVPVCLISQMFLITGYVIRKKESMKCSRKTESIVILAALIAYILLGCITLRLYPGKCMDVHVSRYYNIPICLSMILIGLILVFALFRRYYIRDGILSFIGKNTLVFYMIGSMCKAATLKAIKVFGVELPGNALSWLALLIVICIECALISVFLNKVFPIAVGKGSIVLKRNRKI